jgi:hypothetical protein
MEPQLHIYQWAVPANDGDEIADDFPWAVSFGPFLEPVALFTERAFAEAAGPALLASVMS